MITPVLQGTVIVLGTLALDLISRRCLFQPQVHGFYRFFAFESILILVVLNLPFWVEDPLALRQVISWILLIISGGLALHGFQLLHTAGHPVATPEAGTDFHFEQTAQLVTSGAYGYIRHPLYASLFYGAWGAFLKQITLVTIALVFGATLFLFLTARVEERENLRRFGEAYRSYMQRTKMFVPMVF